VIVASGNDATMALAEYLGGNMETFVKMMNQAVQAMGLKDTHFVNPTGFPAENHYASAYDLAILARNLITQFPEYYHWYKQKWFKYNNIKQPNRNRLLWRDNTVDGLKTGHTDAAGFCLVASAKRGDFRLISVVMGTNSDRIRTRATQTLLNYGFRFYKSHKLYSAGQAVATPRVWLAENKTVSLGVAKDLYITLPMGEFRNLHASVTLPETLRAPIVKGRAYGAVKVTIKNKVIMNTPLIALQSDPKAGFFARMKDHISMTLAHWF